MKPNLTSTPDQLNLQLGPCTAQLSWKQAAELRNLLAERLTGYLQNARPEADKNKKQLVKLQPLADALSSLENIQFQEVLKAYPKQQLAALVRFLRAEHPGVSEKIFAQLSRRAAEQLSDELAQKGPTPLHQVIPALAALEQPLAKQGVYVGINHKAREYLQRLGQLPKPALAQLLDKLPDTAQTRLLQVSQQLDTPEIESRCRQVIPTELLPVTAKTSPEKLDEQEVRELMALVSKELKRLRDAGSRSKTHA
jgi:hypothetical protein